MIRIQYSGSTVTCMLHVKCSLNLVLEKCCLLGIMLFCTGCSMYVVCRGPKFRSAQPLHGH